MVYMKKFWFFLVFQTSMKDIFPVTCDLKFFLGVLCEGKGLLEWLSSFFTYKLYFIHPLLLPLVLWGETGWWSAGKPRSSWGGGGGGGCHWSTLSVFCLLSKFSFYCIGKFLLLYRKIRPDINFFNFWKGEKIIPASLSSNNFYRYSSGLGEITLQRCNHFAR